MAIGRVILSLILFITFVRAGPVPNKGDESTNKRAVVNYRLPDTDKVKPVSYKLKFITKFEDDNFFYDGEVDINLKVTESIDTITLHSKDLNITEKPILKYKGLADQEGISTLKELTNFLEIKFKNPLINFTDSYTLSLKFSGLLNDDLKGFYRSHYTDDEGKKVWLAATHFEPIGARQAFPCFDEPALKAKFQIQIQHKAKYEAISNMHYIEKKIIDQKKKLVLTTFAETPIMSTYLVAFVVSDFDYLENKDLNFRVWARKNAIKHGKYSLDNGQKALKALETYTGITMQDMGFEKMENIAIPQFSPGAMENWGLVTYRENSLLVEENVTKLEDKESVATVLAHEYAHQFFGNLVSPKWWTFVWLNEGFANYFQYLITNQTESTWRIMDVLLVESLQQTAFVADSDIDAVAMNHAVESPSEISEKFNSISYSKAGSIIRMISNILGETNFQEALKAYLKKMKEQSADSDDLFKQLQDKFPKEGFFDRTQFEKALNNWAETPGFPVITVERDYVKNTSIVTQERFFLKDVKLNNNMYYVPINLAQSSDDFNNTEVTHWLKPDESKLVIPVAKNNTWAIFNKQQYGYYRVNYDEKNWQLIINTLNSTSYTDIHVLNRAQLVDDSLNLARISKLDYKIALELVSYLKNEKDYIPWYPAYKGFQFLNRILATTEYYKSFQVYVLDLLDDLEKTLKYDPTAEDEHLTKYHRISTQIWACTMGSKSCRNDASAKIDKWLSDPSTLSPDHKSGVLCAAVRNANKNQWNQLFDEYLLRNDSDLLEALGCSSDKEILKNYLHRVSNKSLAFKNREDVFSAVYTGSAEGVDVALTFLTEEYHVVLNITNDISTLQKYFKNIGTYLTHKRHIEQLEVFANHVTDTILDFPKDIFEAINESITRVKANVKWIRKADPQLRQFFEKKVHEHKPSDNNNSITLTVSTILLVTSFVISLIY